MMFDIFLYEGCWTQPPALDDLVDEIPALKDPALRARIEAWRPGGFLGLNLPENTARFLLARLKAAKARGYVVLSAYRNPKISVEAALRIGQQAIAAMHETHFPNYTFEPVQYWRESPWWWTFAANSKQLQEEGRIPGSLFADVDKLDGHVWPPEESERLLEGQ